MRFIPSSIHGFLDYLVAVSLTLGPVILGLRETSPAVFWVSIAGGLSNFIYSLLTAYERSVVKRIPFRAHLVFDALIGVALIATPFVTNTPGGLSGLPTVYALVMGVGIVATVALTNPDVSPTASVANDTASRSSH